MLPCTLALSLLAPAAQAALFFSEYVEGSSNNKAIEIFNNGDTAVDLAGYNVAMYFNGAVSASTNINLTGTLEPGGVFVLAHASATATILAAADQISSASWYNGDDAIVLRNGSTVVDRIGQVGFDPGTQWGSGDASTADNTLRRKPGVATGDLMTANAFDPSLEWDGFAQDTFSGLGSHTGSTGGGGGNGGNCGDSYTLISAIQGSGASSPLAGNTVSIEAIVVADLQGAGQLGGFFVQQADGEADGDMATSEGIYVAGGATAVSVGDHVRVTGTVSETYGMTQLVASAVTVCAVAQAIPSAANVSLPVNTLTALERYEGMRVTLPQTLTVSETYALGRYGQVLLSNGRLLQPTNVVAPGAAANALQAQNDLNKILLDDGSNLQNPDPVIFPAPGLSAANTLRGGDTVAGIVGVLGYDFGEYRVIPTQAPSFVHSNPRPAALAAPAGTNLRVASFNVLNYFNGDGLGGGFPTSRGADTAAEFQRQTAKTVSAILGLNADVIGLTEIENDGYGPNSAIAELVQALNLAVGASVYSYVNPGVSQIGTDEIAVGFIYRNDRVAPQGNAAILDASVDPQFIDTRNRPALAQTFRPLASNNRITVVVNHLKSKGSACDDLGDPDTGDGQGNCAQTRTAAAQALVNWLQTDPTGSADADYLIIGDLNAYAKEDPIAAITGAGYADLIAQFAGASAYSYVFDGQAGYLDHALASPALKHQVLAASDWHINADEPIALDYNTEFKSASQQTSFYAADAFRSSDHDPLLVAVKLVSDLDGDGDVDNNDVQVVLAARNTVAVDNDPRDINRDGFINVTDARALSLQCTRARCAIN
ncbi:MAG: ExeM/NucH family extracellular endonuclease [Gammaproteobacteria bacterium]|nr:ExeM/NucH family extracellular endonuclease [Gammaproteobacteria bacterium]